MRRTACPPPRSSPAVRLCGFVEPGTHAGRDSTLQYSLGAAFNAIVRVSHRKGFVKIALQTGAALVPVYTFGENDVVTVVDTRKVGWARSFQRGLKGLTGFTLPFVYGRGLFGMPVGMLPHRVPLTAVVGAPIQVPKFTGQPALGPFHSERM